MFNHAAPADPAVHEAAVRAAYRCRRAVQAALREEEWAAADWEFYLIIRGVLEEFVKHEVVPGNGRKHAD